MENLLLPRRVRLFNNGGKLHFQNFSALFQGALSTSFPSGKYHCKAKSLSKTISRLRHITPKATRFPFREMRRTLLFWNRIVGGGNAHSYACLRLFLHASTKVSCVGFIIRCPFREMRRMLLFWPTDCRKRQSVVLCLHTPFPREYTVSRGDPDLAMPRNDIRCVARKIIFTLILPPPKKSEFWWDFDVSWQVLSSARTRRKSRLWPNKLFFSFVCLLLACSFSPKVQKYLLGSPTLKTARIRWIFGVLDGFVRGRVLRRT